MSRVEVGCTYTPAEMDGTEPMHQRKPKEETEGIEKEGRSEKREGKRREEVFLERLESFL